MVRYWMANTGCSLLLYRALPPVVIEFFTPKRQHFPRGNSLVVPGPGSFEYFFLLYLFFHINCYSLNSFYIPPYCWVLSLARLAWLLVSHNRQADYALFFESSCSASYYLILLIFSSNKIAALLYVTIILLDSPALSSKF
jgi:hypothetical protein